MRHRSPETLVGIVTAASRDNEQISLCTLQNLLQQDIGMQSTVIIGNFNTFRWQNFMVTPRGYKDKYNL
jgi:precorrin-3B C17-methyltransferase